MGLNGITQRLIRFAEDNHYVDVADKIPIFACSIGAHIFNCINISIFKSLSDPRRFRLFLSQFR